MSHSVKLYCGLSLTLRLLITQRLGLGVSWPYATHTHMPWNASPPASCPSYREFWGNIRYYRTWYSTFIILAQQLQAPFVHRHFSCRFEHRKSSVFLSGMGSTLNLFFPLHYTLRLKTVLCCILHQKYFVVLISDRLLSLVWTSDTYLDANIWSRVDPRKQRQSREVIHSWLHQHATSQRHCTVSVSYDL